MHWLGEPATTNRTQYLGEAVTLAGRGAVSLLVDAMWSAPEWYGKRVPEQDYENSVRQVVALRRAMDLLTSRPDVDKTRIGYVGHDYGGMYGMLAAGLDRRARTYVYLAVASSLNDWAFFARQPKSKTEYLRQNAPLELTDFLRQVKNASTLYQFAKNDDYVTVRTPRSSWERRRTPRNDASTTRTTGWACPRSRRTGRRGSSRSSSSREGAGSPRPRRSPSSGS